MKIFFTFFILLISSQIFSQSIKISGTINEPIEHNPVNNAVVALINRADSILYSFTRSDKEGNFSLKDVPSGKYILMITQPHYADRVEDIEVKQDLQLPTITLISKAALLQEVIIKSGSPLRVRGDTTIYTADSFKVSANANVEELLKKLPGIQVDKDGKIKAMGESVQKVLVDGEEFFGDDPGMAVKNLRADAVKEVQVFDKKSEQAEFTGIDDGKTQKTINLKLKEDKKTGYFGKADIAAGPVKNLDTRYNSNLLFSSFKGKRKLSAFFLNGNTGQDGLSWQDEQKYGGGSDNMVVDVDDDGGSIMIFQGGSSDDEPYINTDNGFITNTNAGLQYSNKWNDKYNFNFTPRYNRQQYENNRSTFTRTNIGDSVLNSNSNEVSNINRYNYKLKGIWDLKLDSANTLKITTGANFYHTESDNMLTSKDTGDKGTLKNTNDRHLQTNSDKSALSANVIFKHKFKKARRTFSLTGTWNSLDSKGVSFLKSETQEYFEGQPSKKQDLDQKKPFSQNTQSISAQVVYTEPLSKEYSLELAYRIANNSGNNSRETYNLSPGTDKYESIVDTLSNEFKQNIIQNIPSFKVNFANKKLKVNLGSGFGFTDFKLQDLTYNKDYDRNYVNFYPTANVTYTYKSNHSIRFTYNGNTTQPTINQLQPLRNNTDVINQYIGNPDLKPSFTNSFNLSHNGYNFLNDIYMYQSLNFRITNNSITNSRVYDEQTGKSISQPVNIDGNVYAGFYGGVGFKIKKIDLRVDISPNIGYNRFAEIINNVKTFSTTITPGLGLYLNKSKEKKYDISLGNRVSYNSNSDTKIHYYINSLSLNGTIYYKKVWSLISDYTYSYRQKTAQSAENLNFHILNLRLQRTFKNDEFTVYVAGNDLFNQNIGIDRYISGKTYSETINDRLQRYFQFGFTWNFKNKGTSSKK